MKTATAQNGRVNGRSAHKIAEKLAKSAGVDFDDWIAAAIAEYAGDLGVDPHELNDSERLEAIEERIDRIARKPQTPSQVAPERGDDPPPIRGTATDRLQAGPESPRSARDELADEPREARRPTSRRAAGFAEPDPLEQAVARIERRAQRAPEREPEPVRTRVEDAIQDIERRAERSERRAAQALESLAGLLEAHGGENERLQRAIAEVEARAEKTAARTASALEALSGAVEARKADRERLDVALARIGRRTEQSEARAARALESLATQVQQPAAEPPERDDPVASRLGALARRAARAPEPAAAARAATATAAPPDPTAASGEDEETFRLVVERLAQRRRQRHEAGVEPEPVVAPAPTKAQAANDPAVVEMLRQLRRLADKVETLRPTAPPAQAKAAESAESLEKDGAVARIERQLAGLVERIAQPASAANVVAPLQGVERRLDELGARVDAAVRRPAPDSRPLEELARRVEAVRAAIERQGADRPDSAAISAALAGLNDKLDRAAAGGAHSAATMTALQGLIGRLEETLQRPATLDPRPIEELSRRIEGVRGLVERQGGLVPRVDEITAAVSALNQKLPRAAATSAEIERLEAGLRQLSAEVQALGRAEPADMRPVEALTRRVEEMRKAVDDRHAFAPEIERLENTLADIRARLERPAQNPQIEAVDATLRQLAAKFEEAVNRPVPDSKPIEELSRRIDAVRGLAERGFAPHAARLEASLADIRAKVDEANTRPAFDTRPIEELSRRIDAVRGVAEQGFAPHAARLDEALADIRAQFDKPIPEIDAALRALAVKIEQAISRPTTVSLDPQPIEELARRIEGVREALDRPPALAPRVERLEDALGAVTERLERTPILDAQGINSALAAMNAQLEEAFRRPAQVGLDREPIDALAARVDAVRETIERQGEQFDDFGRPIDELGRRLETLREAVERQSERFDGERLEAALRDAAEKLSRPGVGPEEFRAVVSAIHALAAKIDDGAAEVASARVEDLMERVADRLDRPGSDLVDAITDLAAKIDRPAPDLARLEALMEQAAGRFDPPADLAAVADAIAELSARLDRESGAPRAALLEDLIQDVAMRLEGIESKLDGKSGEATPSDEGLAQLELGMRELAERMGEFGGVAQELRALQDRIEEIDGSGAHVEQTSQAIARSLAARLPAASPEALLGHLQDIHERLDAISSMRPGPAALEQAMIELTEELEAFRSAREAVGRGASTLSEMRAEQMQFDRRMDTRFAGVQEILEKLVEKLDRDVSAEPPRAQSSRAALLDIPDRSDGERRPLPDAGEIAAPARGRDSAEANNAKSAAINAHIAAARRAANAAIDSDRRDEAGQARKVAAGASDSLPQRAATALSQHRRPVLLGVAGVMTLLTGVAVLEMRGHAPVRKSELEMPASPLAQVSPLAQASPAAETAATDTTPIGAISPPAKVIAAPLAALPKAESASKPAPALVAALPSGLGGPLAAAGANGDIGAEVEVAQRFLEGRGVSRDPQAAAAWMQAAATAGNPFAQYRLGAMYEKGIGVARDVAKARELYKTAADAGNARAMHNLAVLYAQDGGAGKPDYTAAVDWFRKAGAYGVRDSQFNLGVLYGRGLGEAQNLAESWMWFSLAAHQGDPDAAKKRDEVENRMDGRVLAQAKKLLDGFKLKTPAPAANEAPPVPAAAAAASAPPADAKAAGVKG